MASHVNSIVIGAGQAGLAIGYQLKQRGVDFLLVDSNRAIGDSWRNRYDSLVLFTSRAYSSLPGFPLSGDPDGYATKDEIADYLKRYAKHFELPVELGTRVQKLSNIGENFHIATNKGKEFTAENVIIATGPFQRPSIPSFANQLSTETFQIHSADYRNPSQLAKGSTLIVGGGNSGMQIAAELAIEREVYLSVRKQPKFIPNRLFNKDIFRWLELFGIMKLPTYSHLGKFVKNNNPIIGLDGKKLIHSQQIKLLPSAVSARDNKIIFEDETELNPPNIIWATGYKSSYAWIDLPSIFDKSGMPIHERGITNIPGLYFIGLPWQYRRGSALLYGVGEDAAYITSVIGKR